jgi:hypothetical protein
MRFAAATTRVRRAVSNAGRWRSCEPCRGCARAVCARDACALVFGFPLRFGGSDGRTSIPEMATHAGGHPRRRRRRAPRAGAGGDGGPKRCRRAYPTTASATERASDHRSAARDHYPQPGLFQRIAVSRRGSLFAARGRRRARLRLLVLQWRAEDRGRGAGNRRRARGL